MTGSLGHSCILECHCLLFVLFAHSELNRKYGFLGLSALFISHSYVYDTFIPWIQWIEGTSESNAHGASQTPYENGWQGTVGMALLTHMLHCSINFNLQKASSETKVLRISDEHSHASEGSFWAQGAVQLHRPGVQETGPASRSLLLKEKIHTGPTGSLFPVFFLAV